MQHTHSKYLYRALQRTQGSGGRSQRPSPSRQAHRPTRVSEGKGSGGGEDVGQGARVEDAPSGEMQVGGNGGGDPYLSCVPSRGRSRNIQHPGLEVGVEIRRPEAGAGTQSGTAKGIDFSEHGCSRCAMPTLLATLPPRFKYLPARSSCTLATVRYTCLVRAKGGWSHVCARSRGRGAPGSSIARRPTRFARPVPARRARPGPRSPSRAAISPSSEGLSGPHHADKTNFCGGSSFRGTLA